MLREIVRCKNSAPVCEMKRRERVSQCGPRELLPLISVRLRRRTAPDPASKLGCREKSHAVTLLSLASRREAAHVRPWHMRLWYDARLMRIFLSWHGKLEYLGRSCGTSLSHAFYTTLPNWISISPCCKDTVRRIEPDHRQQNPRNVFLIVPTAHFVTAPRPTTSGEHHHPPTCSILSFSGASDAGREKRSYPPRALKGPTPSRRPLSASPIYGSEPRSCLACVTSLRVAVEIVRRPQDVQNSAKDRRRLRRPEL
ncbi:hypothetical protein CALVIDRAFT_385422 [Calocera viscosa TUFC12733]|uniref:Uncharacterized protein n=1 Tax=Calocera viscosa (strain TUFC12733) TaxID=1330018 RepID=A0A167Q969_CALVF|nr:hypothetical protein CALVIDRAFT_385422 [Calocera viscosa TUFC12733]